MSNQASNELTLEQLEERHKKERKELQAKVQGLKKTVTKGDKKKKKEVDGEIEKLEKEFEEKCQLEIKNFQSPQPAVKNEESEPINQGPKEEATSNNEDELTGAASGSKKPSKAQKRREKKEKSEAEREIEIAKQAIENEKGPAASELRKIKAKLAAKGLRVKEVKSDGNCMYYAIGDQLDKRLSRAKTCEELREMCSKYMIEHPDDFKPYITIDDETVEDVEKHFREYCKRVLDVTNWGGQLELKALSDALNVTIDVVQADGAELLIGSSETDPTKHLVITYHRLMYGAGEHYNSTEPDVKEDTED